ncbi:gp53-like domain-containing protein, partial [Bacteroides sp. AF27-33]|uniref:gp53-like domain-containing protein n=3 Tax=unclassified Bacteroides TaxID=2646097 RepID=UPI000EFB64AF
LSQNGYYKLPDGLMIQWGKKAGGSSYQGTITLPLSFYDDYYSLACSAIKGNTIDLSSWVVNYLKKTKSSFNYICTYAAEGNGQSSSEFHWIAIGRWK